jgi:hypothetical protein
LRRRRRRGLRRRSLAGRIFRGPWRVKDARSAPLRGRASGPVLDSPGPAKSRSAKRSTGRCRLLHLSQASKESPSGLAILASRPIDAGGHPHFLVPTGRQGRGIQAKTTTCKLKGGTNEALRETPVMVGLWPWAGASKIASAQRSVSGDQARHTEPNWRIERLAEVRVVVGDLVCCGPTNEHRMRDKTRGVRWWGRDQIPHSARRA